MGRVRCRGLPSYATLLRIHPLVGIALVTLAGFVLVLGFRTGKPDKAVAYLGTMVLGAMAVDALAGRRGEAPGVPVRNPKAETLAGLATACLGVAFLSLRFLGSAPWDGRPVLERVGIGLGSLLFAMPVALAGFLLARGYRAADLGLRPRGLLVAPLLLAMTAGAAALVDPGRVTLWPALVESGGWSGLLFMGLISAALPEEFLRFVLQTRLGASLGNGAAAWLAASVVWALLHVPVFGKGPDGDLGGAVLAAVRIVPLGLLWGYVTRRCGSILPAVVVHGFNLWGLQNG